MAATDLELLSEIGRGNSEALGEFFDRHAPRTLGLLVRWMPQRADAEDALQEVFWQVWRQAKSYDPRRSEPLGWLFLLTRSRALDIMRRRSIPVANQGREPQVWLEPAENLQRDETQRRIHTAMTKLPVEQRRALSAAFFSGLTYEQVANEESIPLGTAKTRIRLGLGRLRELLREEA